MKKGSFLGQTFLEVPLLDKDISLRASFNAFLVVRDDYPARKRNGSSECTLTGSCLFATGIAFLL